MNREGNHNLLIIFIILLYPLFFMIIGCPYSLPKHPIIVVSTDTLIFDNTELNKSFSISNIGTDILSWSISDEQDWLSVDPNQGETQAEHVDSITVTVNNSSFQGGEYPGRIKISSNSGKDKFINVIMRVPELSILPESIIFNGQENSTTFAISNSGAGRLNWSLNLKPDPNELIIGQNCLSVTPSQGYTDTEIDILTVVFNEDCAVYFPEPMKAKLMSLRMVAISLSQ
ncbi:MAG: BACON domain-containing protein [bacterium]